LDEALKALETKDLPLKALYDLACVENPQMGRKYDLKMKKIGKSFSKKANEKRKLDITELERMVKGEE